MTCWLKSRWAEPSTRAGLGTLAIAVGSLLPPGSTVGAVALAVGFLFGGQAVVKRDR